MAKRYDPIMCMLVDEPTKAQDAMPSDLKKAGYEVGTVEKYGSMYYTLVYNGKVISTSPTEANIVEKAKKHYANRHGKAQDAEGEKWITMRGSHVKIDGEGNAVAGNAKVKNIINNGKAGSSKESSGSTREKLSSMSRADLNHFAEMYGDYDDAESFRKEDIIEDMIEEHGEEKVGKMLNTFNEMFSKGKEKKKENPVVTKKKNESANSNASAREKLSGMSRSDLEHFAEMYGGYEDARGVRKDDIIDDMIDDYGEEKVNKMLETYNGIFKKKGKDSASIINKAIKTADGMFASAFGEYSKGAKFKKDKFLKELAGISDAKEFAKRMQTFDNELRKNLERLDEAYNVAGKDYYAARNEIRSIMDAFSNEAFSLYRKLDTK